MITPSAIPPTSAACSGCRSRTRPPPGRSASSLTALDQLGSSGGSSSRSPVMPRRRRRRRSRAAASQIRRGRSGGVVGATRGTSASPPRRQRRAHLPGLLERHVGHDRPGGAGRGERGRRTAPAAVREDHVRVDTSARPGRRRRAARRPPSTLSSVAPARSARGRRRVDHRAVGERIREGHAELDQVGARVGVGLARPRSEASRSGKPPIM